MFVHPGVTPFDEGDVDEATCAFFGGTQHPLLSLIPAPDPPPDRLRDLSVITVADLPWPHNPWRHRRERGARGRRCQLRAIHRSSSSARAHEVAGMSERYCWSSAVPFTARWMSARVSRPCVTGTQARPACKTAGWCRLIPAAVTISGLS